MPVHVLRVTLAVILLAIFFVNSQILNDFVILIKLKSGLIHQVRPLDKELSKWLEVNEKESMTVIFFKERTYVKDITVFPSDTVKVENLCIDSNGHSTTKKNDPVKSSDNLQETFLIRSNCQKLIITGKIKHNITIQGFRLFLEHNLGCFKRKGTSQNVSRQDFFHSCQQKCAHENYFGVRLTEDAFRQKVFCVCENDLLKYDSEPIRKCAMTCQGNPYLLCGGINHFSMFSKERAMYHVAVLTPTCMYEDDCDLCPQGRKGIYCELVDCRVHNGACVDMACDYRMINNNYKHGVCKCKDGYYLDENQNCLDVDECAEKIDHCDKSTSKCENTESHYTCKCLQGYALVKYHICEDLDECRRNRHKCHAATTYCVNNKGSYDCNCKNGFYRINNYACDDIDECAQNYCDDSTTECENKLGSYECSCKVGFKRENVNRCQDIDECSGEENRCDFSSMICLNIIGSFKCHCKEGYSRINEFVCKDIDECSAESSSHCDVSSTRCTNIPGSYECKCFSGYARVNFFSCKDLDECKILRHDCSQKAICENTAGSFFCSCPEGMEKFVYQYLTDCQDIDECQTFDICEPSISICLNMEPGYMCICRTGFVADDNFTCKRAPEGVTTTVDSYDDDIDYDATTSQQLSTQFMDDEYILEATDYVLIIGTLLVFLILAVWLLCKPETKSISSHSSVTTAATRRSISISNY